MSNVIDFQKARIDKADKAEMRKKELEKRRKFVLNMEEANILVNAYINYINLELEYFQEYITEEDKEIGKSEIKIMFSLLRMLFKKFKKTEIYGFITMSWNYKNLYYSIMSIYESLDVVADYEYLEREEKTEINLYYRMVELDHKIAGLIYGETSRFSELPNWMREHENEAETDHQIFRENYSNEFLNKVLLLHLPNAERNDRYFVMDCPTSFKELLRKYIRTNKAEYGNASCKKGWILNQDWDALVQDISMSNVEVIGVLEQEKEEVAQMYNVELLEEQIADIINRIETIGLKVSDSFLSLE